MDQNNHGIRKAAVLVTSLDRQTVDLLLDQLEPQEAQRVRQAVIDLGPVDPAERDRIVDEFLRVGPMAPFLGIRSTREESQERKQPPGIELDDRLARKLSVGAVQPSDGEAFGNRPSDGPPFRFLHDAECEKLSRVLSAERPQTISLVLSHLPPEQAGRVLARFAPELQTEVVRRLVTLEETDPAILREVEQALESRFSEHVRMQRRRVAGLSAVAGMLEATEQSVGMQILDNLGRHDQQLAEKLGPPQLEFDDLASADGPTWMAILDAADSEVMTLALVGAPPELVRRILRQLPEYQSQALRHRLDHLQPTRLSDMEEARQEIADLARRLVISGRIKLPRSSYPLPTAAAA